MKWTKMEEEGLPIREIVALAHKELSLVDHLIEKSRPREKMWVPMMAPECDGWAENEHAEPQSLVWARHAQSAANGGHANMRHPQARNWFLDAIRCARIAAHVELTGQRYTD